MKLADALAICPAVAIIRGVTPEEAVPIVEALYAGGIRAVEVPLNSPNPLRSIEAIAEAFGGEMAVGAGTVLTPEQAEDVAEAGGKLIVSPNTRPKVILRTLELGLESIPGIATPTEAFVALAAGARHLKLFPAATYGPGHVKQMRAVLPADAVIWAVGGVEAADLEAWWAAGVRAFGIGSEIYKAGQGIDETLEKAKAIFAAAARLKA